MTELRQVFQEKEAQRIPFNGYSRLLTWVLTPEHWRSTGGEHKTWGYILNQWLLVQADPLRSWNINTFKTPIAEGRNCITLDQADQGNWILVFAMTETKKSSGMCSCFCKRALTVLTILCAVGGVIYVTGFGRQINEAITKMISSGDKTKIQRRR